MSDRNTIYKADHIDCVFYGANETRAADAVGLVRLLRWLRTLTMRGELASQEMPPGLSVRAIYAWVFEFT